MSTLQLQNKFPLLSENMTLQKEVQTVNDIRLGMFTDEMGTTEINKNLDELLPSLSEAEICTFLQNLSAAYGKVKVWAEKQRKVKISLDVDEREKKLLDVAAGKRAKKEKKNAKLLEQQRSNENGVVSISQKKVQALVYDDNPALNKAIKEMVAVTKSYSQAVAMLKSIGALGSDYKMKEGI